MQLWVPHWQVKCVLDYSIGEVATVFTLVSILINALSIFCGAILTSLLAPEEAQAIPAFARKYNTNCMDCHTEPPMLSTFGHRFFENGYQLPGTEDGGSTGKKKFGDLNLDDVNQYLGVRLSAMIGAMGLSNILKDFEWLGRQSNVAGGHERRAELDAVYEAVRQAVLNELGEKTA